MTSMGATIGARLPRCARPIDERIPPALRLPCSRHACPSLRQLPLQPSAALSIPLMRALLFALPQVRSHELRRRRSRHRRHRLSTIARRRRCRPPLRRHLPRRRPLLLPRHRHRLRWEPSPAAMGHGCDATMAPGAAFECGGGSPGSILHIRRVFRCAAALRAPFLTPGTH